MDEQTDSSPARSRIRWVRLLLILAIGGGLFAALRFNPWIPDGGARTLASNSALLATVVAALVWLLFNLSLQRRTVRAVIVSALALVLLGAATFRIEYDGHLNPSLKLRTWAKRAARRLGFSFGDVFHKAHLADPPLVLEPQPGDALQFFGPQGNGHYPVSEGGLARDWSARPPRELWRVQVGAGWSSFAVVGKYGFTQEESPDQQFEQVTCYDLTNGAVMWTHGDEGYYSSSLGGDGPRATPAYFAGKLVTVGPTGLLNCFDASTGRRLWSRNVVEENDATLPDWGTSSSPLVFTSQTHGDLVVQSAGGPDGRSLHAYQLADGKEVWHVGNDAAGYSTPKLYTLGGVQQIVIVHWQAVTGHDPETGAELWRFDDPNWHGSQPKVPQPIVLDDRRVFISAGYGTGSILLDVARGDDGRWTATTKWKSAKLKPKFMTPVVRDGFVYGLDDGEFLVCLDLADGDLKWRSKRGSEYGHGQVLLVGDLLIVQTETGDVALVEAKPDAFQELGRFTALTEGVSWNVPVLDGRNLLLRNNKQAACYELPPE